MAILQPMAIKVKVPRRAGSVAQRKYSGNVKGAMFTEKAGYQKRIYDISCNTSFELYDMVYSATDREKSLKAICERYGVKRLTMFMNQPFCEREESVTYNKKNGLDYQSRNYFPLPCNEYLDEDEMIEEKEEEAE